MGTRTPVQAPQGLFTVAVVAAMRRTACVLFALLWMHAPLRAQLSIDKAVDVVNPPSGGALTYTIQLGCSDLVSPCVGAVVVDTLPPEVVFSNADPVIVTSVGGNIPVLPVYDPASHTVTWDFTGLPEGGLPAGFSASIALQGTVQAGTVPDGAVLSNKVVLSDNGGAVSDTANSTVVAVPDWDVSKEVVSGDIYHDTDVIYRIRVSAPSAIGNLNLTSAFVVDTLPPGAVYVSASPAAVYDPVARTVSWTGLSFDVNIGSYDFLVTVQYPASDPVNDTGLSNPIPKTNVAYLEGTPVGGGTFSAVGSVTQDLLPPSYGIALSKVAQDLGILPVNQTNFFQISLSNNSTVPVDSFSFEDPVPDAFDLVALQVENFPAGVNYDVLAELNHSGTFVSWVSGAATGVDQSYDPATIPGFNPATDYVSGVRVLFGTVPSGFSGEINLVVTPNSLTVDNAGNPITVGASINNTASLVAVRPVDGALIGPVTATDAMCVWPEVARLDPAKLQEPDYLSPPAGASTTGNPYFAGARVKYTLRIENDGTDGTGANLTSAQAFDTLRNPVAADLLPAEVVYVPGTWVIQSQSTGFTFDTLGGNPVFERIDNWNGTGRTLLRWYFTGDFLPGQFVEIAYNVDIPNNTPTGTVVTNEYCLSAAQDFICDEENCGTTTSANLTDFFGQTSNPALPIAGIAEMCCKTTSFTVADSLSDIDLTKSVLTSGPFAPVGTSLAEAGLSSDTVEFEVTLANTQMANDVLPNPVAMDLLPQELEFVPGSLVLVADDTGLGFTDDGTNPVVEVLSDYAGTGRTLIRWSYTGEFPIDSRVTWRFKAFIKPGAIGSITNSLYSGTDGHLFDCVDGAVADLNDLDGDGDVAELLCATSAAIDVPVITSLGARKYVKGACDADFLTLPDTARTFPGDSVLWRTVLFNPGNQPLTNVVWVDIFPYLGDVGVRLNDTPRETGWVPYLVDSIAVPAGVTLFYSQSTDPCRDEIEPVQATPSCVNDWTTTPPADLSLVKAIKIELNDPLMPADSFVFDIRMMAPQGSFPYTGAVAWNSFARNATEVPAEEPPKVGVLLKYFDLALKKQIAAGQPAQFDLGDDVTFDITVYNQGLLPADSIQIVDYFPTQLTLNDGNWQAVGLTATRTLAVADGSLPAGGLSPGDSVTASITFRIDGSPLPDTTLTNWAEIAYAIEYLHTSLPDVDSWFDAIQSNDKFTADDQIDGDGKGGEDEDDHDRAVVEIRVCRITEAQVLDIACRNGGTGSDTSDDFFLPTFHALASDAGPSGKYELVWNGIVLNPGGTTYGTPVTVGQGGEFAADGTVYSVTIRDIDDGAACATTVEVGPVPHCITCPPLICLPPTISIDKH